jgi:hypothetical protein
MNQVTKEWLDAQRFLDLDEFDEVGGFDRPTNGIMELIAEFSEKDRLPEWRDLVLAACVPAFCADTSALCKAYNEVVYPHLRELLSSLQLAWRDARCEGGLQLSEETPEELNVELLERHEWSILASYVASFNTGEFPKYEFGDVEDVFEDITESEWFENYEATGDGNGTKFENVAQLWIDFLGRLLGLESCCAYEDMPHAFETLFGIADEIGQESWITAEQIVADALSAMNAVAS